jgi:hypothetical protein
MNALQVAQQAVEARIEELDNEDSRRDEMYGPKPETTAERAQLWLALAQAEQLARIADALTGARSDSIAPADDDDLNESAEIHADNMRRSRERAAGLRRGMGLE